jgi:superfamily II DNA or RNA helicase
MTSSIHEALKLLDADHRRRGEASFIEHADKGIWNTLARQKELTPLQKKYAARLVRKYLAQLSISVTTKAELLVALSRAANQTEFEVNAKTPSLTAWDVSRAEWGPKKIVITGKGSKERREAVIPPAEWQEFFAEWRKGELTAKGYTIRSESIGVGRNTQNWYLQEWSACVETEQAATGYLNLRKEESLAFNHVPELRPELAERFEAIKGKLLDYQHASVKRLVAALDTYSGALDASDTGTGKTYSTLAACAVLGMRPFVICPKSVKPSWRAAAGHFEMRLADAIGYEKLRTGGTEYGKVIKELMGERPIKQVDGTTRMVKQFRMENFTYAERILPKDKTIVVFDEVHRVKATECQNSVMAISALTQGYKVLGLSATAADNPTQMKFVALLTGLISDPKQFNGWKTQNAVSNGTLYTGGREVLHRIHKQIFPTRGTRIRIADLGDAFPPTKVMAEVIDCDEETLAIVEVYREMHAEIAKLKETQSKDTQANILVAMLRARQMVELLKVPTMCSMVKDAVEEGMAVAVILNFSDTIKAFSERLKCKCIIQGGQNEHEREKNIQAFQSDTQRCIILNIRAGGVGVSLHGKSDTGARSRLALISPTYSGQDLKQALGRVHRAGGARSIQKICFAANTIEEEACKKVKEKLERIASFNEGVLALQESELEAALTI